MTDSSSTKNIPLSRQGVTWLGLIVNLCLAVTKVLSGVVFRSQTILADGLHSVSDMVTDVAVLAGLRVSEKPADEEHRYGHLRVSTLVAMFVGAALLAAAVWIAYNAIITLHVASGDVRSTLPFWIALVSIPVKELLYQVTRQVGKRTTDASLIANAWHHRTDAFTSIAAAAGLAGVAFGGPGWAFLDHLTAAVLAAFLAVVAVKIIAESAGELIDRAPSEGVMSVIGQVVSETEGVRDYHAFRARKVGGKVDMDIHILVDPTLTVREGHDIATAVKQRVLETDLNVVEAIVHIEPVEDGYSGG